MNAWPAGHRLMSRLHVFGDLISRPHLCSALERAKQKIMDQAAVSKTHLMFGGMHIYVNRSGGQFKIEHIAGCAMEQHPDSLLSHAHQLVPYDSPIDVKVLRICLRRKRSELTQPQSRRPARSASTDTELSTNAGPHTEKPVAAFRIHYGLPVTGGWLSDYDSQ